MDDKLYGLMNWPEIESVVYSECENPSALLGGHLCKEGFLIQVFRPDALSVSVNIAGKAKAVVMEKVDEAGFFAVLIASKKVVNYTLTITKSDKSTFTISDPYAFQGITDAKRLKAFAAGNEKNAETLLGSRVVTINKIEGVLFSVWAPHALGVSVKGDFNNWDGRVHQMNRIGDTGVYELFVPGLTEKTEYLYELRIKGQTSIVKLDPYARGIRKAQPYPHSVVTSDDDYKWNDALWLSGRAHSDKKSPMSIYEVDVTAWGKAHELNTDIASVSESIIDYVKAKGFTHIELMPMLASLNPDTNGYTGISYYTMDPRYGSTSDLKSFVDACHTADIGIIFDWNCAYFGDDNIALDNFDGDNCYGYLKPSLEKNPDWKVVTFAYERGEVRSFLMSNLAMLLDEFHIDGVRIDGVASMLYLDYGKAPSTWTPNIYGGNENLAAIDFLKNMNNYVRSRKDGVITIAEESSGWAGVTNSNDGDNLGFDYKWNDAWRKDFLKFFSRDPLFRKGEYDNLTYGMLYNYSEDYCLSLSHDNFTSDKGAMIDIAAGAEAAFKLADMRAAYGYMFTHPGTKLIAMGQAIGLNITWPVSDTATFAEFESSDNIGMGKFITDLNALYRDEAALHELDSDPSGFEWLEDSNPDETVIAYARKAADGRILTVIVNFTPVKRDNHVLSVLQEGRYREIFNSNLKKYGGDGDINTDYYLSDVNKNELGRVSLKLDIPASSVVVLECDEYSDDEILEITAIKKAAAARVIADKKAKEARELAAKAKEDLTQALEAEKRAKEAARVAMAASEAAKKQAKEAEDEYKRIDEELKAELADIERR